LLNSTTQRRALCLALSKESLQQRVSTLQDQVIGTSDDLIYAYARTAADSAPARSVPGILIVRGGASPGMAVVGELEPAAIARVEELFDQVEEATETVRYVSYAQAVADVRVLAERLEQRFTRAALDDAIFRPVPRGGLIVLGMLSLVMGLRHEQLDLPPDDDGRLVVLVDDCALSGHRIHQTLRATRAQRVALAFLYAPIELCCNIESREDRVQGCVAARRLHDIGPELLGSGYGAWVERWSGRLGEDRYWIGRPEAISFAWKDPDRSFVNRVTGQREASWRVMPGNLAPAPDQSSSGSLRIEIQPEAKGPLQPAKEVFFAEIDGTVVLAHTDHEAAIELSAVAGAFWSAIIEGGSVSQAADRLHDDYDTDRARLETDLARFVDDLLERGLMERLHPQSNPGAN
jgi:hypothetical protein